MAMESFVGNKESEFPESLPCSRDLETFGSLPSANERFDASQYDFFGTNVTQEVELGGLDEDDDVRELDAAEEAGEDTFSAIGEAEETGSFGAGSSGNEINDLASSFMKVNTLAVEQKVFHSSLDLEPAKDKTFNSMPPHGWLRQQYPEERASGYHQKQQIRPKMDAEGVFRQALPYQQQQRQVEDLNNLNMLGTFSLEKPQNWHGQTGLSPMHSSVPYSTPNQHGLAFSSSQHQYSSAPPLLQFGGPPNFGPQGPLVPPHFQSGKWMTQSNVPYGGNFSSVPGLGRHPLHPHSPLMPSDVLLQYQRPQTISSSVAPPYGQIHHQHIYNNRPPSPQGMRKFSDSGIAGEQKDERNDPRGKPTQKTTQRFQPSIESNKLSMRSNMGLPQMRSKYMTVEEVENIVRIQWAATHTSDPYVDDYYHQAVQAKLEGGTSHGRRHFAPSQLRDLPSHTRAAAEPHAFLQVDALGRIPFSSIRRPRPLLEMETSSDIDGGIGTASNEKSLEMAASQRRLEQEPLLAARIAIEDGLCLLLDVDDIDRLLSLPQVPDGGTHLRRRRQILLEGLAASLHLVDPLASTAFSESGSGRFGLAGKDDLIFLRLVSLPKGRKLVARYLRLIVPGSDLGRIVTMAVLRHLRFLFGGAQTDKSATVSSSDLENSVAYSVMNMDLASLSACVAVVVLAPEPPPLRPLRNFGDDGGTLILQAVLERATNLLKGQNAHYPLQNRAVWQASFDAFFVLLSKYCNNKYESILHSLMMAAPGNIAAVNASAASAMAREMPIELLRACIPHTNEQQRQQLLELAQKSIIVGGTTCTDGHANVAAV